MAFERYVGDAHELMSSIPYDEPVREQAEYLLNILAGYARQATTTNLIDFKLSEGTLEFDPRKNFAVAEVPSKELVDPSSPLAGLVNGKILEMVIYEPFKTMVLPPWSTQTRLGNGALILHSLQHIADPQTAMLMHTLHSDQLAEIHGQRERHAYTLQEAILHAVDGSDYDKYVESLPIILDVVPIDDGTHNVSWKIIDLPSHEPPKDTLTHTMWEEGGMSPAVLAAVGVYSFILSRTKDLPVSKVDRIIGNILNLAHK